MVETSYFKAIKISSLRSTKLSGPSQWPPNPPLPPQLFAPRAPAVQTASNRRAAQLSHPFGSEPDRLICLWHPKRRARRPCCAGGAGQSCDGTNQGLAKQLPSTTAENELIAHDTSRGGQFGYWFSSLFLGCFVSTKSFSFSVLWLALRFFPWVFETFRGMINLRNKPLYRHSNHYEMSRDTSLRSKQHELSTKPPKDRSTSKPRSKKGSVSLNTCRCLRNFSYLFVLN